MRQSHHFRRAVSTTLIQLTGVLILVALLDACTGRQVAVRAMADILSDGVSAYESDDDLEMLGKAFPAHIKLVEAILVSDPQNRQLLNLLSRAYGSYAFIFYDGRIDAALLNPSPNDADRTDSKDLIETATNYYRKGLDYAIRALEIRHPDCRQQLSSVATVGRFIDQLESEDLPSLFWYGYNLSAIINLNRESIGVMAGAHRVEKSMQRTLELDESYFHSAAHLVLFGYYAARSPLAGGNPSLALKHYRRLKQIHGNSFLLTDLYYARYYLYHRQDRENYVKVLKRIVDEPVNEEKFRLFNKVARGRAEIFLGATDILFID